MSACASPFHADFMMALGRCLACAEQVPQEPYDAAIAMNPETPPAPAVTDDMVERAMYALTRDFPGIYQAMKAANGVDKSLMPVMRTILQKAIAP